MLWCYFFLPIYVSIYLLFHLLFHVILLIYLHNQYLPLPCIKIYKHVSFFVIQLAFCFIYEILIKITSWILLFWKPKPLIFLHRSISTYSLCIQSYRKVPPLIRKCLPKAVNTWNCEEPWKIQETFSPNVLSCNRFIFHHQGAVGRNIWEWSGKDIRSLLAGNKIFKVRVETSEKWDVEVGALFPTHLTLWNGTVPPAWPFFPSVVYGLKKWFCSQIVGLDPNSNLTAAGPW